MLLGLIVAIFLGVSHNRTFGFIFGNSLMSLYGMYVVVAYLSQKRMLILYSYIYENESEWLRLPYAILGGLVYLYFVLNIAIK